MDYDKAKAAMEEIEIGIGPDEDGIEALAELVALFRPYEGDDPEEARKRKPSSGFCANCKLDIPMWYAPAPVSDVAKAAIRLSKCPRCFSTKIMMGENPTV